MREYELVPNAKNLMESTRAIGYSLPAAVADLIDNSIAAGARRVEVSTPTEEARRLIILDDGVGMDSGELLSAMRYGSRFVGDERDARDLGRFGLGLKVASLSQCRSLTVLSKREGLPIVGARWDLDHVAASERSWALQILEEEDLHNVPWYEILTGQKSGTLVVWEKLDVLMMGVRDMGWQSVLHERMRDLREHLALVFHRYIGGETGEDFQLIFNENPLEAIDPFLRGRSQKPFATDCYRVNGIKVEIEPFILPHPDNLTDEEKQLAGDLQKDQGFYVYRNKRLVIWGTWFRLGRKLPLSKLARVRVDIPASVEVDRMWSLDVKKSSALIPEELRIPLKSVVERLGSRSGEVWRRRARRERSSEALWIREKNTENVVRYAVNEDCPLIQDFLKTHPDARPVIRMLAEMLPLNSIYADLAGDKVVDNINNDRAELIRQIKAMGWDASVLEDQLF